MSVYTKSWQVYRYSSEKDVVFHECFPLFLCALSNVTSIQDSAVRQFTLIAVPKSFLQFSIHLEIGLTRLLWRDLQSALLSGNFVCHLLYSKFFFAQLHSISPSYATLVPPFPKERRYFSLSDTYQLSKQRVRSGNKA